MCLLLCVFFGNQHKRIVKVVVSAFSARRRIFTQQQECLSSYHETTQTRENEGFAFLHVFHEISTNAL